VDCLADVYQFVLPAGIVEFDALVRGVRCLELRTVGQHCRNMTALLVILSVVSAISIAIVLAMFWWGAREDGRDQKRRDARLRRTRR
jgi:hypothetical protein